MTVDAALVERVRSRLVRSGDPPTAARVAAVLRSEGAVVGDRVLLDVVGTLRSELAGAGPLESLLADPDVTDVLVNGPSEVWVDRGDGLQRSSVGFADAAGVGRLAQRLAAAAGRRLDAAQPTVDARLPNGVRLHAVLPPISPAGPLISLRIGRSRAFTLVELQERATVTTEVAHLLREMVRRRITFLVTGGTGSGKTTLLSSLLSEVAQQERIVLVEDSGELRPTHPHVVRLEARHANVEGTGQVDLRELVRQSLRMRPDRLVVGEVRGAEVVDLLAALNTGHEGGCGTVHANSADALPARLEALALAAGLGRAALHSQLLAAVQLVVHVVRDRDGARRVAALSVLERSRDGLAEVVPALVVDEDRRLHEGPGASRLAAILCSSLGPA